MKISKELKIGFTAIVALIIIYSGMMFLKGLKLFSDEVSYYVEMKDVQGLPIGSEVMAKGMRIGNVKDIVYDPNRQTLVVEINVMPTFQLPSTTNASIAKEMLGTMRLILNTGDDFSNVLAVGDTIKGEASNGVLDMAADMVPQIQALLPKLDSILTAVNTLVNDPSLANSLHNMEKVSADLTITTAGINSLLSKDVPHLMAKANNICTNLESTTYSFSKIDLNSMATKADQTLTNFQEMSFKLNTAMNSKNNSLGMLLNDNSIALRLDTTLLNSSLLLEDMKKHPSRYVHFSVFGKKDK